MPTRRCKVDRGPAFEIPTQNEGIVVQQSSQAVLTACYSLCQKRGRGQRNRATSLRTPVATGAPRSSSEQPHAGGIRAEAAGLQAPQRCTHPPMQGGPSSLVGCVSCGSLLQEEVDAVDVAVHDRQHQWGSVGRRGLGTALRSGAAPRPDHHPETQPQRKAQENSLAVDVHDIGDVCPLPAVYQEVQGISVPVGSCRQQRKGVTNPHRRVPPSSCHHSQRCRLVLSSRAHVAEQTHYRVARLQGRQHTHTLSWKHVCAEAAGVLSQLLPGNRAPSFSTGAAPAPCRP